MDFRTISLITITSLLYIPNSWADDLTGKWKTIDDKSGFPRAIINISKNTNASYDGKIEKIYTLPNGTEPLVDKCVHCKGGLKDKPMIGLNILSNFILNEKKPNEYINGQVIDPITGNTYKGKIKMNPNGKKITLRGYIGTSLLGRSQIWIRMD